MTKDKYEAAYEAAIVAANAALTALKIEQAELYPPEDPDAWNNLSDAEKLDVYGALMLAEGAVAAAELKLKTYKEKKNNFYNVTKKEDMDAFEATYKASKKVKDAAWQDKEDYAMSTGDWELVGYTADWAETI